MGYLEFCSNCGARNELRALDGRRRMVCPSCETVHYVNPRPAATVLLVHDRKLLLVRRAEPPAVGQWCLPGGFLELGESAQDTARRELNEETGLGCGDLKFLAFCSRPGGLRRDLLIFSFITREFSGQLIAGDDASDARFFPLDELPPVAFLCHREMIERMQQIEAGSQQPS